jgi:hypothetical protein
MLSDCRAMHGRFFIYLFAGLQKDGSNYTLNAIIYPFCTMAVVHDTIRDVLIILQQNLEAALNNISFTPDQLADNVVISNIAFADNEGVRIPSLQDKIVLTLTKIEEEFALKNQPAHRRNPVTGSLEYVNPPAFLNLYVLVTANNKNYDHAMLFLSRAIGFFQFQRVFTEQNTVPLPTDVNIQIVRFNFNINMVSPTFEQINHMWGVLGGKQLPSALYKLQLVEIEYRDTVKPGFPIEIIEVGEKIF